MWSSNDEENVCKYTVDSEKDMTCKKTYIPQNGRTWTSYIGASICRNGS